MSRRRKRSLRTRGKTTFRKNWNRCSRHLRFQSLEDRRLLSASSAPEECEMVDLSIFIDGAEQAIPASIGLFADGSNAELFTLADDGQVFFDGENPTTLADFFRVWREEAGLIGNNPDAILSSTQILTNQTDFENTLQVFVNGLNVEDFVNYEFVGGESIDIVYGDNPVVAIRTNFGNVLLELFDQDTPITVDNFLNYVNDGDYNNAIFHRLDADFVLQGGGFGTPSTTFTDVSQISDLPADAPILNEPGISNTIGTVAMAKLGGNPNSATNEFFFNLSDNAQILDGQNGGFTVFGQVLSMTTLEEIATLPIRNEIDNTDPSTSAFGELPVSEDNQLVVISSVEGQGELAGTLYFDLDGDGTQDVTEGGIDSWTVYLDENNNGQFDDGEVSALTDVQGRYLLQTAPGDYTLRVLPRAGSTLTVPTPADSYEVTVEIGREIADLDFAFQVPLVASGIDLLASSDTGNSDTDDLTNLNNSAGNELQFLVTGVAAGAEVRLFADGTLIGLATAEGTEVVVATNGTTELADGDNAITARLVYAGAVGDESTALDISIDATSPEPITSTPDETVNQINLFSYDAESASEGESGVVYSLANAPITMSIDATTGLVQWTPFSAETGPEDFTVLLTDAAGNSVSQDITVTVLGDLAARPDTINAFEGITVTNFAPGVLNNDGNGSTAGLIATLVEDVQHGTLSLSANGSFQYTSDPDFFGTDSFIYRVSNQSGTVGNEARVTINVRPVDDAPRPESDSYDLFENTVLTVDAAAGVLANDVEVDGETLRATLVGQATKGEVVLNEDGSFTYTPNTDANGPDSFTYEVRDRFSTIGPVTVSLNIIPVDGQPVASDDSYDVAEDGILSVDADTGVLDNDVDTDGDPLVAVIATQPTNGSVSLAEDGSFTYTPNADFFGTDTFTYNVNDGNTQDEATVTITVSATPDDPTAVDDEISVVFSGGAQPFQLLTNDSSDPDGPQALTIVEVTQGTQGGTVSIAGDGLSILYTPQTGFSGTDTFEYTIEDTDGLRSTATVTANVDAQGSGSIRGIVYVDANADGVQDDGEVGIPGVLITLSQSAGGSSPLRNAITGDDGTFVFDELVAGTYTVAQSQPEAFLDAGEFTDDAFAVVGEDEISNIVLAVDEDKIGYEFTEVGTQSQYVSIALYFASNLGDTTYLRDAIADAEESAGNTDLAEAIRDGLTSLELPEDEEASLFATGLVDDVFEDSFPEASAILAPAVDPIGDPSLSSDGSTAVLEEVDTVLEETDDWLVL